MYYWVVGPGASFHYRVRDEPKSLRLEDWRGGYLRPAES